VPYEITGQRCLLLELTEAKCKTKLPRYSRNALGLGGTWRTRTPPIPNIPLVIGSRLT